MRTEWGSCAAGTPQVTGTALSPQDMITARIMMKPGCLSSSLSRKLASAQTDARTTFVIGR